jgi:hypothetical protein
MGKHIAQPVTVTLDRRNHPAMFEWRGKVYRVKDVQECWRLIGAWWDGEAEKTFFRIRTDKNGIYELGFDHGKEAWQVLRSED